MFNVVKGVRVILQLFAVIAIVADDAGVALVLIVTTAIVAALEGEQI